jgi:transposase
MRNKGSPAELEHRRFLAIRKVLDGYSIEEVAGFLGVDARSVRRWWAIFTRKGVAGLVAQPIAGRPTKLSRTQEKIVLRWLAESPTEFGFASELWTARRLGELIRQEWKIRFNPRYLPRWLRQHGFSPQKPQRVPRERDDELIVHWLRCDWRRIKKTRSPGTPT